MSVWRALCFTSLKDRVWGTSSPHRVRGPWWRDCYQNSQQQQQQLQEMLLIASIARLHCLCVTPWGAGASDSLTVFPALLGFLCLGEWVSAFSLFHKREEFGRPAPSLPAAPRNRIYSVSSSSPERKKKSTLHPNEPSEKVRSSWNFCSVFFPGRKNTSRTMLASFSYKLRQLTGWFPG